MMKKAELHFETANQSIDENFKKHLLKIKDDKQTSINFVKFFEKEFKKRNFYHNDIETTDYFNNIVKILLKDILKIFESEYKYIAYLKDESENYKDDNILSFMVEYNKLSKHIYLKKSKSLYPMYIQIPIYIVDILKEWISIIYNGINQYRNLVVIG